MFLQYQTSNCTIENFQNQVRYHYKGEILTLDNKNTKKVILDTTGSTEIINKPTQIECTKERFLTYFRNELVVIKSEEIAYAFIENTTTFVITNDGRKTISNSTLEGLFMELDSHRFFKVNRQIIVRITAIDKIIKMGKSLKIHTNPKTNLNILVGKNKTAAFKKWLNG